MIKPIQRDGKTLFQVLVGRRSTKSPTIRVQKKKIVETREQAEKIEIRLGNEVAIEVERLESEGDNWGGLVRGWYEYELSLSPKHRSAHEVTLKDNFNALGMHTESWLQMPAKSINRADVKNLMQRMKDSGLSDSRQRAVKGAINSVFDWAIDHRKVDFLQSPARGVKVSRNQAKKPEILTHDEIKKLVRTAGEYGHPWAPIWEMALNTGMRSGELHAILWSDYDEATGILVVEKSWNGRLKKVKMTKNGKWRQVPVNPQLRGLLQSLKKTALGREHILPRFTEWDRGEAADVLRDFCTAIGIKSVCFHTLRACFATTMLGAGVSFDKIMDICGWATLNTMNKYIRLAGVKIEGATDGLDFSTPKRENAKIISFKKD